MEVWQSQGPAGAPTLVLLHGVSMTAELGWSRLMPQLSRKARLVAPDLRGHGKNPLADDKFSLEQCADDVAGLLRQLGLSSAVVCGYSMGGMVAQVLWRRHPELVRGLILCATGRNAQGSAIEQVAALAMPGVALAASLLPIPSQLTLEALMGSATFGIEDSQTRQWARQQLTLATPRAALRALHATAEFNSSSWVANINVPTAVVVTTRDSTVPATRQRRLARAIPHAAVIEIAAEHAVFMTDPAALAGAVGSALDVVSGGPAADLTG
jgi:3-oxoadipate enol-lactonase